MKKLSACFTFILLSFICTSLQAQDSIPRIIIGDISVYESADSIAGEGIQGRVAYDASTNTLTLHDAAISSFLWAYRTEGSFKVKLLGDNSIERMISSNDSCTFFGPGTLTLGGTSTGIALDCAHTDFLALAEGATVDITASEAGIYTIYDDMMDPDSILHVPVLVVDNSSLTVTAPLCFEFIPALWLSECHVVEPAGFEYQLDTWLDLSSQIFRNYLEIRAGSSDVVVPEFDAAAMKPSVYPNPTDNLLTVELSNGAGITHAVVYDLQGRIVADMSNAGGRSTATVNVHSIPAGVYLLRVTDTDGKEYHQKIVKK